MPDPQGWSPVPPQTAPQSAPGWTLVQPASGFKLGDVARVGTQPPAVKSSVTVNGRDISLDGVPDQQREELARIATRINSGDKTIDPDQIIGNIKAMVSAWGEAGPHRVVEGLRDLWRGNYAKGANSVITGAGVTAAPMLAPEVLPVIAAAPGATALTLGAGAVTQAAVPPTARALGATPDQADLAGTVANIGAGTAMAKLGVPALARWSTNNKAASMGVAYAQSTRDLQAALGVKAEDVHLARPFLEAVHANGIPIAGKEDAAAQLVKASDAAIEEIEAHVSSLIRQFPNATVPPSSGSIYSRVAQMKGSLPSDMAAAKAVVAKYGLDQPRSLAEADGLRARLNAENRAVLDGSGVKQRDAVMTDPKYVARQEAANSLRDQIYGTLEQNGVQGIRDLRRGEGAVSALRNKAIPLTSGGLRGEATVARTGETSLPRRLAQKALTLGGAAGGAAVAGPFGAAAGAEVGGELGSGLTTKNLSKNALIDRAFRQSFTSPPIMSVQGFRAPVPTGSPQRALPPSPQRALPPVGISQGYP